MNFQNDLFDQYFAKLYGKRWTGLSESLRHPEVQILRKNIFVEDHPNLNQLEPFFSNHIRLENSECAHVYKTTSDEALLSIHNHETEQNLKYFYKMDPASFFAANALPVQPGQDVLDLCAAPGGKSLILAEKLQGTGQLVANEFSHPRRERLMRVMREYIPMSQRQNIFVTGKDGNAFGQKQPDSFDCVLADVPCSGERHLLENATEFKQWTPRRSENLSVRQFSLLSSAYLSCRVGGYIVYSTCSISNLENDDVVKKLMKRRSVKIVDIENIKKFDFIEKTECGYQILPDKSGFGPMYYSLIQKVDGNE